MAAGTRKRPTYFLAIQAAGLKMVFAQLTKLWVRAMQINEDEIEKR